MDLVSVYITTYNRIERLKRAIESVESQTYSNIEIIVSDDNSTDGTREFMEEYVSQKDNVIYLRNEINSGACVTRNNAIFRANGKYITGLDDDDTFTSDRIESFMRLWDDKYSFLCANFFEKFSDGTSRLYYKTGGNKLFNYEDLLFDNVASNQVFTLTKRLKAIGGFVPNVRRLQDWDTWLRLSYQYGTFLFIDEGLYIMNHDHSPSELRVSSSYSLTDAIEDFLNRNRVIFGNHYRRRKCYIDYLNHKLSMRDAIYWAFVEKNPKNAIRYLYQFKRK